MDHGRRQRHWQGDRRCHGAAGDANHAFGSSPSRARNRCGRRRGSWREGGGTSARCQQCRCRRPLGAVYPCTAWSCRHFDKWRRHKRTQTRLGQHQHVRFPACGRRQPERRLQLHKHGAAGHARQQAGDDYQRFVMGWIYLTRLTGPAYSASKRAMIAMTESLNMEDAAMAFAPGDFAGKGGDRDTQNAGCTPVRGRHGKMLQADDLARTIKLVCDMPPTAAIHQIVIAPTWNRMYLGFKELGI